MLLRAVSLSLLWSVTEYTAPITEYSEFFEITFFKLSIDIVITVSLSEIMRFSISSTISSISTIPFLFKSTANVKLKLLDLVLPSSRTDIDKFS